MASCSNHDILSCNLPGFLHPLDGVFVRGAVFGFIAQKCPALLQIRMTLQGGDDRPANIRVSLFSGRFHKTGWFGSVGARESRPGPAARWPRRELIASNSLEFLRFRLTCLRLRHQTQLVKRKTVEPLARLGEALHAISQDALIPARDGQIVRSCLRINVHQVRAQGKIKAAIALIMVLEVL